MDYYRQSRSALVSRLRENDFRVGFGGILGQVPRGANAT
jgi:hypothetical protein